LRAISHIRIDIRVAADHFQEVEPVICPQCQAMNEQDSMSCGDCGNSLTADQHIPWSSASQYPRTPAEQYVPDNRAGQYIPSAQARTREFRLDMRRLSRVEQIAGGATLIVLISLFLPWFGFNELGTEISVSATAVDGYVVIVVLLAVLMAGYLLWRSGWEEFPVSLPITHETLLLVASGLQFLLVTIAFLDVPDSGLSREFGAYLALIASVAAFGPAVIPAIARGRRRDPSDDRLAQDQVEQERR
jgi:hypothetical protein